MCPKIGHSTLLNTIQFNYKITLLISFSIPLPNPWRNFENIFMSLSKWKRCYYYFKSILNGMYIPVGGLKQNYRFDLIGGGGG